MYDAIIVGARCAGSPTAMLLAPRGFKALLVDRATFPSDTFSTHILWPHGAEILARWGLLGRLAATGAPPICRRMTFNGPQYGVVGTGTLEDLLAAHEAERNGRVRPMYEFTSQLAALEPPPPAMRALFGALHGNQDATNAFLSAITGAIPLTDFLSNENLARIMAAAKDGQLHR